MNNLVFLDVEATGTEKEDRLIQVAYRHNGTDVNELFTPPVPVKLTAMAVHHITDRMLAGKPSFSTSQVRDNLGRLSSEGAILVAHNARYDLGMLAKEGVTFERHICTLKIAKYIDQGNFENHQLQYLRYFYGVEVEASAHDAWGDILVLEAVFKHLYEAFVAKEYPAQKNSLVLDGVLSRMVEISTQPSLIKSFGFGKYVGKTIADVAKTDRGYLEWLLEQKLQKPEGEDDWIYTLKKYLGKV